MGESEEVRVGGEEGRKKDGSTPGMCPRFLSSACVCVHMCVVHYKFLNEWVFTTLCNNIIHGHALDNNLFRVFDHVMCCHSVALWP